MTEEPQLKKLSAAEIKAARKQMGFTISQLAQVLRMGSGGARKIQRWEAGDEPVSGPASVAIAALLSGWRPN